MQSDPATGLDQHTKRGGLHTQLEATCGERGRGVRSRDADVPIVRALEAEVAAQRDEVADAGEEAGDADGDGAVGHLQRCGDAAHVDGSVNVRASVVIKDSDAGRIDTSQDARQHQTWTACGLQGELAGGLQHQGQGRAGHTDLEAAHGEHRAGAAGGHNDVAVGFLAEAEVAIQRDEVSDARVEAEDGDAGHAIAHVQRGAYVTDVHGRVHVRTGVVVEHRHAGGGDHAQAGGQHKQWCATRLQGKRAVGLHEQGQSRIVHAYLDGASLEHSLGITSRNGEFTAGFLESEVAADRDEPGNARLEADSADGGHAIGHLQRRAHRSGSDDGIDISTRVVEQNGQAGGGDGAQRGGQLDQG